MVKGDEPCGKGVHVPRIGEEYYGVTHNPF